MAAFQPYRSYDFSDVLVVGNDLSTVVNVTSTGQTTSSVSLNWLDAKQISLNNDITGIVISANATVSVIAGTTCSHVPQTYRYDCGLIAEQMIPTDAWENEYIVPNMPPRAGVLIRVLSLKHQDVCFYTQRGSTCKQFLHQHLLEFSTGSEPVVVRSNTTISVVSYGVEGGPFMTVVPGIKNFMNYYYFVVPSTYSSYNNSLAVVIQSSQTSGLILDGSTINSITHDFNVPQPFDSYSVLILRISTGYHKLSHQNANVKFGAFLYGNGNLEGYGLPIGIQKETGKKEQFHSKS
ncbi:IgGFc-binding protein-like [Mercenaria mercenaria]|uniref:IgGFc-binding protein-like n=1 Tax=Mercenaria mercenaria TaxID=6596 RepID=UPI001E1D521B|nr:IgGFc-binding protein-like [Mercenaria mercenaria]